MSTRPPRLLRQLLAWALPDGQVGDGLLGDLDELYGERVGRGRTRADLWYARQVLSAVALYALRRPRPAHGIPDNRPWSANLGTDLRQASRTLLRKPGFTGAVVLTLALGIGATTAIFSVIDGVLLRPLPFPEPDRLVRVLQYHRDDPDVTVGAVSREEFADLQRQEAGVYESLAAFSPGSRVLTGVGEPAEIAVTYVTERFFQTLGVSPVLGRGIASERGVTGRDDVAVLSHGFWENRFGSSPDAIGSTLTLDGTVFTVLGVMPRAFDYPSSDTDVFLPASVLGCDDVNCHRAARFLRVVGRLGPDATTATASAAARSLFERLEEAYPETNSNRTGTVISLRQSLVGDVRPQLLVLLAAVGFLLLITCANIANLMLARSTTREREFAIRSALGAGRSRVARHVLMESLALAVVGGALGFLLAVQGVDLLVALGGGSIPRSYAIHADLRVATFAVVASVVTGVLFGVLPSFRASRVDVHETLKAGRVGAAAAEHQPSSRQLLVGLQTALAVILVTGAALLVRSFWNLTRVDTGFQAENVLSIGIRTDADVMAGEERNAYRREIIRRIAALPGVTAVGGAKDVPLHGISEAYSFTLPERPDERVASPQTLIVLGDYFEALGIPLLAGRRFTDDDETDRRPVVIVNRAMARRHWGEAGAVGETLRLLGRVPVEVVGIVGDVRYRGIAQAPTPTLYVLPHFGGRASMTLFVRTPVEPLSLADDVRRAIWQVNPDQALEVGTMERVVSTAVAEPRFISVLLGSFAGLALALAMLGLYGVTAYEVSRRTYDAGVRIALGASTRDVLRWIVAYGAPPVMVGVVAGLVVARGLTTTLSAFLYGIGASDPLTFATVPVVLAALGLLAIYLPARRATRVDPIIALRSE